MRLLVILSISLSLTLLQSITVRTVLMVLMVQMAQTVQTVQTVRMAIRLSSVCVKMSMASTTGHWTASGSLMPRVIRLRRSVSTVQLVQQVLRVLLLSLRLRMSIGLSRTTTVLPGPSSTRLRVTMVRTALRVLQVLTARMATPSLRALIHRIRIMLCLL